MPIIEKAVDSAALSRPPQDAEALLEASWEKRGRPLDPRERRCELALTACVLTAIALLAALGPGGAPQNGLLLAVATLAYGVTTRIDFPLGAGAASPSQLAFVALFALAPVRFVPLLVAAGLGLATFAVWLRGRGRLDRLAFTGGDAAYALGPALVLLSHGHTDGRTAPLAVLALAFLAQLAFDLVFTTLRESVISGVRPRLVLFAIGQVWLVDLALTPVALQAAGASARHPAALLFLVPLVGLLAHAARDRSARIARAHDRLQALERERHRLRLAVRRIGEAFASQLDLDALLQIITRAAVDALDAGSGRGSTYVGQGRRLVRRATVGESVASARLHEATELRVLETEGMSEVGRGGAHALSCPIGDPTRPVGFVTVSRGEAFAGEERALLAYLCEQAAIAAAHVTRHELLHRQALTDELTGLANHRRLQELLSAAVERHGRSGAPAALVLLDLDDFKSVNDGHGHQTGDMVLKAVGRCLRDACRLEDEPARYGGEELAVVLSDLGPAAAVELAERLREAVAALELPTPAGGVLRVTASIGVAALGEPVRTGSQLLAAADAALYAAKAEGKDRVVNAPAAAPARR